MKKSVQFILILLIILPLSLIGQITNLADAQNLPEGIHTFNLGNGDFNAYVDSEGWMLWLQYHHKGGTNPKLNVIPTGGNLPIYDNSPLGTDLSGDLTKWGHGGQAIAASIPNKNLWLRWEAVTSHHDRKIHFESPILGKFQIDTLGKFVPEITYQNKLRDDHTAIIPVDAGGTSRSGTGDNVLTNGPFWAFNKASWEIGADGRWNVDNVRNEDGTMIRGEYHTIHRVWIKPVSFTNEILLTALEQFSNHINGVKTLTPEELIQLKNTFYIYAENFPNSKEVMTQAFKVVDDYDEKIGALFTTERTQKGFLKDPKRSPNYELEKAMIALQQSLFDYVFTSKVYEKYPEFIKNNKFKTCTNFPGNIAPPTNTTIEYTSPIRANFADPAGLNPSYEINGNGTEHAFRPTGTYLAPGSVATVTVPSSLVGKDYYVQVGAHEWDLTHRPWFKRLDRISKKFSINSTTIQVFNPMGGAIAILVPYGAKEGIVDIKVRNALEAPFFSLKSFHKTQDFAAELKKPAPWAVFETDNVMYTIPKHSIVEGQFDLKETLLRWDSVLQGINSILGRQLISDKHDLYLITDILIRAGVYSLGYPQSNHPITYTNIPGSINFIDGPNFSKYHATFHEYGHASRISKFPGEREALVNFLYVMGVSYGLGEDLNESFMSSFGPHTFNMDRTATHRMLSNTFGEERDRSNTTKDEVRYQHRGYGHYTEIVNLFGWCALRNFWTKEYEDLENGNDHGVNDQDIDSRIIRMSAAANADLRPLFHVYGIIPQDATAVEKAMKEQKIPSSPTLYDRIQDYFQLIPKNNKEYKEYAYTIYPNLDTKSPSAHKDYGEGWHYQKLLTYNETVAKSVTVRLQKIVDLYFPNGKPTPVESMNICCNPSNPVIIELINEEVKVTGGTAPYNIKTEKVGTTTTVTVLDDMGCEVVKEFTTTSVEEQENNRGIRIFPNPASTKLFLKLNHKKANSVELVSINGTLVRAYPNTATTLDVSKIESGIYILNIKLEGGEKVSKRVQIIR